MHEFPYEIKTHVVPGQHIREYPHATVHDEEDILDVQVKQYIPLNNPNPRRGDVTIIGAHANGLPKELYEPLWEELLTRVNAVGISIRSIWIADNAHQGASGILNESKLGNDPGWFDYGRDINQMINYFRGQMKRPMVGIGHSVGAAGLVHLSLFNPRMLETLILIEPTISREVCVDGNYLAAAASARRRDVWPSRAAAAVAVQKSKFYRTWDERVRQRWIEYGLRDVSDPADSGNSLVKANHETNSKPGSAPESSGPAVTLATTKHQEVFLFLRPVFENKPNMVLSNNTNQRMDLPLDLQPDAGFTDTAFYRPEPVFIFQLLPILRPSVQYIFGETSVFSTPEMRADKLRKTGIGVGGSGGVKKNAVEAKSFPELGHMVPFEAVAETAAHCAQWLKRAMSAWREREALDQRDWRSLSDAAKRIIGPEFKERLFEGAEKLTPADRERKL